MNPAQRSSSDAQASRKWVEIIPAAVHLDAHSTDIPVVPATQEVAFSSPESVLDTALALVHSLRGVEEPISTLFPLLPDGMHILLPGPPPKTEGEGPSAPVEIIVDDVSSLTPQAAAAAHKVPTTRLLGALIQSAIVHSTCFELPASAIGRRLFAWLHGLSPLEAYLTHSVILGGRIPRASRLQLAGLAGMSRAAQLRRTIGGYLASDPELVDLFDTVYSELNPLASWTRATGRVPELATEIPLGFSWGASTHQPATVGQMVGMLHPEFDTADGWILINRPKKGAPRTHWTVHGLRASQREHLTRMLRTGGASDAEVTAALTRAKIPLAHKEDLEQWLDYIGLILNDDGTQAVEVAPIEEPADSAIHVFSRIGTTLDRAVAGQASLRDGMLLGATIYPESTTLRCSPAFCGSSGVDTCITDLQASPLGQALANDPYRLAEDASRMLNVGIDTTLKGLGYGPEPLDALEQVGVPAQALLADLDSLLTGEMPMRVAMHLRWAVDRAHGGGTNAVPFDEVKYELVGALLMHPATLGRVDPADAWARLTGSSWWDCPEWTALAGDTRPSPAQVRRHNFAAGLSEAVIRALESQAFRAAVETRLDAALDVQVPASAAEAVNKRNSKTTPTETTPETVPTDLHGWEQQLSAALHGAQLVSEAGLDPASQHALREALRARVAELPLDPDTCTEFVLRYPASVLTALVGLADQLSADGAVPLDTLVARLLDCTPHDDSAREVSTAAGEAPAGDGTDFSTDAVHICTQVAQAQLRPMLRGLGLEEFADLSPAALTDVIVAHAGLPTGALGPLVEALTEFAATVPDRSSHRVCTWLLDPSQREFLLALPEGTRALLLSGGGIVDRLLDEALDVVEYLGNHPLDEDVELPEQLATGLPEPMRTNLTTAVRAELTARAHATSADDPRSRLLPLAAARAADRASRPYLMLDGTAAVCVALPPVSHAGDEPWVVASSDEVNQIWPRRTLGSRETQQALLSRPARRVAVMHPSFHSVVEMRLFTTEFPVALFHLDGRQVPTSSLVPATQLLALIPPGHAATETGGPTVLEHLDPPEGWEQWSLQLWDLDGLSHVNVRDAQGVSHEIRTSTRVLPGLWDTPDEPLEYLVGVRSAAGHPVLATRPWLSLPPLAAGEKPWTVAVRAEGSEEWVSVGSYAPEAEFEGHPLFDDSVLTALGRAPEAPLLGGFEVRVEGPDHARLDIPVFVAEGFYAHYPDSPRLPDADGATPCVAELSCDAPEDGDGAALSVSTALLEFEPTVRTQRVTVSGAGHSEELQIRPPRLEFRMTGRGMAPAWSDQRISRTPFDFDDAVIVVRDPYSTLEISLQLVNSAGRLVHRAAFDRSVDGTFRANTARFAEKVRSLRAGELRAQIIDPEAEGTRAYKRVVPLVRFAAVAEQHITLDGQALRVSGAEVAEDLVCRVWQLERPWLPARSLPVHDGVAQLPAALSGAGRLRVDVVVEDPWDPVDVGPLPHRGSTSLQLAARFSTSAQGLLSKFLAGHGSPSFVPHGLPENWNAWALLSLGLHPSTDRPLRNELAEHLCRSPRAALLGLDRSSLSSHAKIAAYIASGLVNMPIAAPLKRGDTWDRAAAGARRSMSSQSRPREAWIDILTQIAAIPTASGITHTRMVRHLAEVGGDSLSAVLAFGQDPLLESVRLGLPEVQAAMDPTLREILLSRPTIPGPLLDSGSRWDGLLALLRNEDAFNAGYVRDQFERMLGKYDALRRVRPLYRLITERIKALPASVEIAQSRGRSKSRRSRTAAPAQAVEVPMWANIPQLTFSLALLARGHAYGYFKSGVDPDLLDLWSRLAGQAPHQVMIDIVLAEAHLAHLHYGGAIFLSSSDRGTTEEPAIRG